MVMVKALGMRLAATNWRTTVNVKMTSAVKDFLDSMPSNNTADASSSNGCNTVDCSLDNHHDHQSSQRIPREMNSSKGVSRTLSDVSDHHRDHAEASSSDHHTTADHSCSHHHGHQSSRESCQEMPDEVNSSDRVSRNSSDVSDAESAADKDNSSDFDVPVYFGQHQQTSQQNLSSAVNSTCQFPPKLSQVSSGKGANHSSDFVVPKRTRQKLFLCNECGKTFSQKHVLAKHQLIHAGETPFPCTYCKKEFRTKFNLKRHEQTHTGKKPYMCSECGIAFGQKGQLESHRFTHTGKKPHKCDECGKSFSKTNTLNRHKLTHSGEKLHTCSECGKSFTRKYRLSQHKLTHVQAEVPEVQDMTKN